MSASVYRIAQAGQTDTGRVRSANEDALISRPEAELWAVADGMGGHANGQWASQALASALGAASLSGDLERDGQAVSAAIHAANATIFQAAQSQGKQMGSTIVALMLRASRFAVFWAGDSRAYLQRAGRLHRLTRDHTQVQDLVESGYMRPEEAAGHPMAHVLSRAVGVEQTLQIDAIVDDVQSGDAFLLCSDGLYGVVSDAEIAQGLDGAEPRLSAQRLLDLCLARGAPDNVTVVVVACQEPTRLLLPA